MADELRYTHRWEGDSDILYRPDGTELASLSSIDAPEDCTWGRDGGPVLEELNQLASELTTTHQRITALEEGLQLLERSAEAVYERFRDDNDPFLVRLRTDMERAAALLAEPTEGRGA